MATLNDDERFMRAALVEARKGAGLTSPNPAVGAVLVAKNKIVARGHHRGVGLPHAEIECLTRFGRDIPRSSILYVTLEPCSTIGRTGRCTDAIIKSGVRKVVIGAIDPNPDRKSTRLNSSHLGISYAVFCLKKKKKKNNTNQTKKQSYNQ